MNARNNEETKIADQTKISSVEKGAGFVIGSGGIISVFTIFLIVKAVYPATERDAAQPATEKREREREQGQQETINEKKKL